MLDVGEIFELDRATLKSDGVFRSSPRGNQIQIIPVKKKQFEYKVHIFF